MDETASYLGFSHFFGIGPARFDSLLKAFGSVSDAYHAPAAKLVPILGERMTERFTAFRHSFDTKEILQEYKSRGIMILPLGSVVYPAQLKAIPDPPLCLYAKGTLPINLPGELVVAIVGTRKPSPYGRYVTKLFTAELANAGAVIVSGMALGIDTEAHRTTLAVGGRTVAVLGSGVDMVYPPENEQLYVDIIANGGTVVSEYPPGKRITKGLFISRNRIISGLSSGVVVIEGKETSGSLATARFAAIQGREVFVPPIPITSPLSATPSILLKNGATYVSSGQDILQELQ
jgi:DNA processing protein